MGKNERADDHGEVNRVPINPCLNLKGNFTVPYADMGSFEPL